MGAITTAILALVPQGGRILYSDPVYGGTYFFLKHLCPERFGITTVSVDTSNLAHTEQMLRTNGPFDMVFLETPANPTLILTDIEAVTGLVRRHGGLRTIIAVDNTFLGPVFQRPFLHGADLVLYSATKFIGGHSDLLAGIALTTSAELMRPMLDYRTILGLNDRPRYRLDAHAFHRNVVDPHGTPGGESHEDRHRLAAAPEDRPHLLSRAPHAAAMARPMRPTRNSVLDLDQ